MHKMSERDSQKKVKRHATDTIHDEGSIDTDDIKSIPCHFTVQRVCEWMRLDTPEAVTVPLAAAALVVVVVVAVVAEALEHDQDTVNHNDASRIEPYCLCRCSC